MCIRDSYKSDNHADYILFGTIHHAPENFDLDHKVTNYSVRRRNYTKYTYLNPGIQNYFGLYICKLFFVYILKKLEIFFLFS